MSEGQQPVKEDKVEVEEELDDFDKQLKEELAIPEPPLVKDDKMPSNESILEYRNQLYNYYIQYYARFYLLELRKSFRKQQPSLPIPPALSTLPGSSQPPESLDLSNITKEDQLTPLYNQFHFSFNFQASQVYQKWYTQQLPLIAHVQSSPATYDNPSTNTEPLPPVNYASSAYFNKRTNKFQTMTSEQHWASKGVPTDREGRQMSAFFDVDAYEERQREIMKKPPKQKKQSAKYWKQKKEEKKRRKMMEFLKD